MEYWTSWHALDDKYRNGLIVARIERARTFQGLGNRIARGLVAVGVLGRELVAAAARYRLERRTRAALEHLSDQVLKDIGVPRGDIHAIARAAAGKREVAFTESRWVQRVGSPEPGHTNDFIHAPRTNRPAANDRTGRKGNAA
ncbi:DUF1127 domain-containing protein [Oceanibacterium hippocampi]|uniref:YjiS-like domain-containing protein n=1 Tax=Oceanibacterium hippocampi TaxID=745714 RepID=A0A1Y5R6C0_9PROT|nr:DUF1127 domain-containing protein [Oceanibacterium hippocampi]SLN10283.1 hypothetical protein OCH7691_00031 [Oceanibacterium hippocampi]